MKSNLYPITQECGNDASTLQVASSSREPRQIRLLKKRAKQLFPKHVTRWWDLTVKQGVLLVLMQGLHVFPCRAWNWPRLIDRDHADRMAQRPPCLQVLRAADAARAEKAGLVAAHPGRPGEARVVEGAGRAISGWAAQAAHGAGWDAVALDQFVSGQFIPKMGIQKTILSEW